jgi:hypothetical protein
MAQQPTTVVVVPLSRRGETRGDYVLWKAFTAYYIQVGGGGRSNLPLLSTPYLSFLITQRVNCQYIKQFMNRVISSTIKGTAIAFSTA